MIVRIDHMASIRVPGPAMVGVIARDEQPSLFVPPGQLDAIARAGGVPAPVIPPHGIADLRRQGPGFAIVVRVRHVDMPDIQAFAVHDRFFGVLAAVPGHQQPDGTGVTIHDRRRVAAGVFLSVPNDLQRPPSFPSVGGSLQYHVDVAAVPAGPPLAKRQQGSLGGQNGRRDSIKRITFLAVFENDVFLGRGFFINREHGVSGPARKQDRRNADASVAQGTAHFDTHFGFADLEEVRH